MKSLVVSIHDVAPASFTESQRWLEICESHGCRTSLLVIPGSWRGAGPLLEGEFAGWLRSAASRGHEVVMHGLNHVAHGSPSSVHATFGRVLARGCEEFWSVGYVDARERVLEGLAAFARVGLRPRGFVPPGWLLSPGGLEALRSTGFEYTTTHRSIVSIDGERVVRSLAMSQRPGGASAMVAAYTTRMVGHFQSRLSSVMRVALHPADLAVDTCLRTDLALIGEALGHGFMSRTYGDVIRGAEPRQVITNADLDLLVLLG